MMSAPEIILIIVSVSFVVFIFSKMIYNKITGKNTECNSCKSNTKRMIKDVKKQLKKL